MKQKIAIIVLAVALVLSFAYSYRQVSSLNQRLAKLEANNVNLNIAVEAVGNFVEQASGGHLSKYIDSLQK